MQPTTIAEHRRRVERLTAALRSSTGPVRLRKRTSNLFRPRQRAHRVLLDGTTLNHVIAIDRVARTAEVEGMTTYADLVDATLPLGLAPAVVPELKGITVGGATTGVGIESSAFRFGLVHETVVEFDVLVADGRVLRCSPTEHTDLFFGFPNSYGSLGYATRLTVSLVPVAPFVHLRHEHFEDSERYFAAVAAECAKASCDFLDGVFFGHRRFRAHPRDDGRATSGRHGGERLHMDAAVLAQPPRARGRLPDDQGLPVALGYGLVLVQQERRCAPRARPPARGTTTPFERHLPEDHACRTALPTQGAPAPPTTRGIGNPGRGYPAGFSREFPCAVARRGRYHAGMDLSVQGDEQTAIRCTGCGRTRRMSISDSGTRCAAGSSDGHYNAIVEQLVARHGGKKSLYSRSTFDEQAFWTMYDRPAYEALKRDYDPKRRLPGLYEKTVGRG